MTPDPLPGDDILPGAPLSWDREATFAAGPAAVWPWVAQLGAGRAGWYLPARVERFVPRRRRALRRIDPAYVELSVGDRVPDYGPGGWFEAQVVDAPRALVWWTRRGRDLQFSWALVLEPSGSGTRLRVRIRLNRRLRRAYEVGGERLDRAFITIMFAGLRERVDPQPSASPRNGNAGRRSG